VIVWPFMMRGGGIVVVTRLVGDGAEPGAGFELACGVLTGGGTFEGFEFGPGPGLGLGLGFGFGFGFTVGDGLVFPG
jgi:hypothetical protein